MILQSEQSDSSSGEKASLPSDIRKAVMRLEFKAIDLSRSAEISEVFPIPEPADVTPVVGDEESNTCKNEYELREQLEVARQAGMNEGRREAEADCERRVIEERMQILGLSRAFQGERERYFSAVEAEIVKLALAIAARVLHREAKLDPVMLQAVVKIALKRVREESGAVLRVPMSDMQMWRELMMRDESCAVEVIGDPRLERGDCVLDTRVGRVELGVSAQLEEIEKGFFDLLQQRPV
jgi:flagellar assembly protein FliH